MSDRKSMPWSRDAEESVVGGVLLYPRVWPEVAAAVTATEFFHPTLAAIFRAFASLADQSKPIDAVTVAEEMRASDTIGTLRAFNGEAYFADLMSKVVTVENIAYHAKIVRGKATVRRLIETAQEIAAAGYGEHGDVDEYLARAAKDINAVATGRAASGLVSQADSIQAALVEFDNARNAVATGVQGPTITTGYRTIDDALAGGWRPEYIVLGARPSMGKTSLAMDFAEAAAEWGDAAVLVLSLEMKHTALSMRRISAASAINGYLVRSGRTNGEETRQVALAASRLQRLPVWYHDSGRKLSDIVARARAWSIDERLGKSRPRRLIVTDYLQLLEVERERGRDANRHREVSDMSAAMKGLCADCDATVIMLSQLNRSVEDREDKRPRLSDLRESGSVEENADAVLFIYRDEVYNAESAWRGVAEVIIAKQRNGPTGTQFLAWDPALTHFSELPPSWMPPTAEPPRRRRGKGNNPHAKAGEGE